MDLAKFFASVRARGSGVFGTSLSPSQVDGTERIIEAGEVRQTPLRHLAYILATAYHETAHTMQPVREMGGEKYLRSKPYYPWVGEGLVQVTWEVNARKFGATAPGQLMTWPLALVAIFDGMTKGMFTGKKLSDYISDAKADYLNARRIVNRMDRAADIAGYAKAFETALVEGGYGIAAPQAAPPTPVPEQPSIIPDKPSVVVITPHGDDPPTITVTPAPTEPVLVPAPAKNNRNSFIVLIIMAVSALLAYLGIH